MKRVCRRIFEPKRKTLMEGWKKNYIEELHTVYSSSIL
jgi:hypothetical protein